MLPGGTAGGKCRGVGLDEGPCCFRPHVVETGDMRRTWKTVGVTFAVIAVAWGLMAVLPGSPQDVAPHWRADRDGMPRVIAHQGGNQERPGQTNLAFEHAHEIGVGAYVPSLRELFETYPGMLMLIEIKDDGERGALAAEVLRDLIREFGREDLTVVASFNTSPLRHFRSLSDGRVPTSGSMDEVVRFYVAHILGLNALNRAMPFQVFNLPVSFDVGPLTLDLTSRRLRRDIARRGMAVHYWTINRDDEMIELIEMGVDGIITDRPSRLQELIAEY